MLLPVVSQPCRCPPCCGRAAHCTVAALQPVMLWPSYRYPLWGCQAAGGGAAVAITIGWGLGADIACSQDLKREKKKKKVAAYHSCWCWRITMAWKGEEDTGV